MIPSLRNGNWSITKGLRSQRFHIFLNKTHLFFGAVAASEKKRKHFHTCKNGDKTKKKKVQN